FCRAPVRLVHLFLHYRALEGAVGEGVHSVEVHVVIAEEFFKLVALGGAAGEGLRRACREAKRYAKALIAGDPRLHLRHVGVEARPDLLPIVAGMDERRIAQMAETVAEIHFVCSCSSYLHSSFHGRATRGARNPYSRMVVMDSGPGASRRPGMTRLHHCTFSTLPEAAERTIASVAATPSIT